MTALIDPSAALRQFAEDGYVVFRNVLDAELVGEAAGHVEWLHRRYPDRRGEDLSHELVVRDPFWVRLISDDRLLDIAELFVGPDLALFASHYISKPAFSGQPVLWHQDGAFWPLDPMRVVTLWLAIDHASTENGCLRVVPGSHRGGIAGVRERVDIDNVLGAEIAMDVDESLAVDLELAPGDVEVHHPGIVHGSLANTSPNRRCGLTVRYIPTSTRITSDVQPFPSALHLRGAAGGNAYNPRPAFRPDHDYPFRTASS